MNQKYKNWKSVLEQIADSSEKISYSTIFDDGDYSQVRIGDDSGLFSCDITLTSDFEELHDVSFAYSYQHKDFGFTKNFEGCILCKQTENFLSDFLSPYLVEGWWIQKFIFISWYKTEMMNKHRNQYVGAITFHRFGLLIWILSLFDILSFRKWIYIEPIG